MRERFKSLLRSQCSFLLGGIKREAWVQWLYRESLNGITHQAGEAFDTLPLYSPNDALSDACTGDSCHYCSEVESHSTAATMWLTILRRFSGGVGIEPSHDSHHHRAPFPSIRI